GRSSSDGRTANASYKPGSGLAAWVFTSAASVLGQAIEFEVDGVQLAFDLGGLVFEDGDAFALDVGEGAEFADPALELRDDGAADGNQDGEERGEGPPD